MNTDPEADRGNPLRKTLLPFIVSLLALFLILYSSNSPSGLLENRLDHDRSPNGMVSVLSDRPIQER